MATIEPDALAGPEGGLVLTRRQITWAKFRRHKAALVSLYCILALYGIVLIAEFVAPYDPFQRHTGHLLAPPTASTSSTRAAASTAPSSTASPTS